MSERRDSNPESPVPKTGMLAVTLRSDKRYTITMIEKTKENRNIHLNKSTI